MLDAGHVVRFSEEDTRLFSEASGDRNPLHVSMEYASRTAYGERVVFGVLGAIACLSYWQPPIGERVSGITLDFLRPMFLDVNYCVKSVLREGEQTFSLYDGSIPVVSMVVQLARGKVGAELCAGGPTFAVSEPMARPETSIGPGLTTSGVYACDPARLEKLLRKMHFGADPFLAAVLCWASYNVGMELPGQSGLFRRLVLTFEAPPRDVPLLQYEVSVLRKKPKLGQVVSALTLRTGQRIVAQGKHEALIRPEILSAGGGNFGHAFTGDEMAGRVALIIGGSRGFGSALDRVLKAQGATAIQFSRSGGDTQYGNGDASDPAQLLRLRERIIGEHGHLDLLVCNAFPAIHSLWFEPNTFDRIQAYLSRATALVAAPLCVFLELLNEAGGRLVVISSSAVESPVREWPQYVAAKSAVEGYARVAPLQYPRLAALIVRPPKLLTDLTNTPLGRSGAKRPEEFAVQLAKRLQEPVRPGICDIYPTEPSKSHS
jgi:NAD(P)-dependent dehydrogenase (short-subunit alcohol dehydrogenase family)